MTGDVKQPLTFRALLAAAASLFAALVLAQGMSRKQVCADLGISKSALQAWVRKVEFAGRAIVPAASGDTEGQREQAKMLKRIRELKMENEILRKAAAYLSQANLRIGSASPK